jgi:hypothetical protein
VFHIWFEIQKKRRPHFFAKEDSTIAGATPNLAE